MRNNRFCWMVFSLLAFVFADNSARAQGKCEGMAQIKGGKFMAGLDLEKGYKECQKYHALCQAHWFEHEAPDWKMVGTFSIDRCEVTQADYIRVTGNKDSNPSGIRGANLPVSRVTWDEADTYCRRVGKRLPTEWEWEFAAKGGKATMYPWGNEVKSMVANLCDTNCDSADKQRSFDDGHGTASPVGSYPPNGYGLYDMAGNVWEWTASDYDNKSEVARKVLRGGSWLVNPDNMRIAFRRPESGAMHDSTFGFRCAR